MYIHGIIGIYHVYTCSGYIHGMYMVYTSTMYIPCIIIIGVPDETLTYMYVNKKYVTSIYVLVCTWYVQVYMSQNVYILVHL